MKKKKSERVLENKKKRIRGYIFLIVLFLSWAFVLSQRTYKNYRLKNYGVPCKAYVLKESYIYGWHSRFPSYIYTYYFEEEIQEGERATDYFCDGIKIGDTIDIIVDPDNPSYSIPVK
ncbi:MAG: hypothetical protein J5663_10340 [Bacteroidaceae bacterium]|nr:hypothetical protein [Bacteroidaceae bacterium]